MQQAAGRRDVRRGEGEEGAAVCSILEGDESDTLQLLLSREMRGSAARLVGEVQLAYVCFLLLHSMSAFEHWKLLVASFCSARRLAVRDGVVSPTHARARHQLTFNLDARARED